ncbi:MAG TPA: hypothetical protein PKE12_10285 [Kiritimatiellia bacterium]|nr:hypothetical protein [Kiritimatiellia bacterium]
MKFLPKLMAAALALGPLSVRGDGDVFVLATNWTLAASGVERLAYAPTSGLLLSPDRSRREIHLHRVDWKTAAVSVVDAFPPTDAMTGIPTPGAPVAVAAHPTAPLALALSRPPDVRTRGEVLFLDLRERTAGRLLRSQLIGFQPAAVAISADGRWAVVLNKGDGNRRTPGSIGILDLQNLSGWENDRLAEAPYRELGGLDTLLGTPLGRLEPGALALDPEGRIGVVTFKENDAAVFIDFRGDIPALAGAIRLSRGSRPAGVALLPQPDGTLLMALAEKAAQHVSFHRIALNDAAPAPLLLSRVDVRPLVHGGRPGRQRDPETIVLRRMDARSVAWVASEYSDRVVMLDVTDARAPVLLGRAAAAKEPADLLAVERPDGWAILAANRDGTASLLRAPADR